MARGHQNRIRCSKTRRSCSKLSHGLNLDFHQYGIFSIASVCRADAASMDVTKPELRCLLAGGAGGSARTRRKRNNPQHESPQSLATALTNVIQQWQPSNQNTPEDHTWGWRKRRKQANNSWQGYRADSSPDTSQKDTGLTALLTPALLANYYSFSRNFAQTKQVTRK